MNNRKNGFQYGGSLPLMNGYHHASLPFSSYHFHHQPPLLPLPLSKASSIKSTPGKTGGSGKKRRNGRKETRSMKMETISHHHYDVQSSKTSEANNIVKPLILGTVYSPPPSSLPLPRFSLIRAKTPSCSSCSSSSSSSSCIVEAIGGGKETVTTDDLRRIFGL
ncbi:hypothetical protein J5N97_022821 [Dioscorea zingiberensis]|uniref:Uncharacterized protein n=1 Tax=Dioscorea zingiberensis TaxID=325984 RepID=A0A9D5CBH2_9LILI|nr:hypothetical protein J5N97_022821 [Dioscorea zingiberensis]